MFKRKMFITVLMITVIGFTSCNGNIEAVDNTDDIVEPVKENPKPPKELTEIQVIPGFEKITINWDIPNSSKWKSLIIKYENSFTSSKNETYTFEVTKDIYLFFGDKNSVVIQDLYNNRDYVLTMKLKTSNGEESAEITKTVSLYTEKDYGYIVYSDGTTSEELYENKTPIGVICGFDQDGNPSRILSLKESGYLKWSKTSVQACKKDIDLDNEDDGYQNWLNLANNVTDENGSGNYPAFEYCNNLKDGNKKWYLPAENELKTIAKNAIKINQGLKKIKAGNKVSVNLLINLNLENHYSWSSSYNKFYFDSNYYKMGLDINGLVFNESNKYLCKSYITSCDTTNKCTVRAVAKF